MNILMKDANGNNLRFDLNDKIIETVGENLLGKLDRSKRSHKDYEDFIIDLFSEISLEGEEVREDRKVYYVGDGVSQNIDSVLVGDHLVDKAFMAHTGENGMVGFYDVDGSKSYIFGDVKVSFKEEE